MQDNIQIELKKGREKIAGIDARRSFLLVQMSQMDNPKWQELFDERFKLLQEKRTIQNEMGKLVKGKRI